MGKLREVGVLVEDPEFDCERVHDWDEYNPAPKRDTTAAERQRRRRDKLRDQRDTRDGHAPVTHLSRRDTRDVTPPEVEGEGEDQGSNLLQGSPLKVVGMSDAARPDSREPIGGAA